MSEERCKTCKWWDAKDTNPPLPHGNGACQSNDFADDVLAIVTHEGPADSFWTAPEFGCVHWETKG